MRIQRMVARAVLYHHTPPTTHLQAHLTTLHHVPSSHIQWRVRSRCIWCTSSAVSQYMLSVSVMSELSTLTVAVDSSGLYATSQDNSDPTGEGSILRLGTTWTLQKVLGRNSITSVPNMHISFNTSNTWISLARNSNEVAFSIKQ